MSKAEKPKTYHGLNVKMYAEIKLTLPQEAVLYWFVRFMFSKNMKWLKRDVVTFFWICHKTCAFQMDHTSIKSLRRVQELFKNLVDKHVLYYFQAKDSKTHYALTEVGWELIGPWANRINEETKKANSNSYTPRGSSKYIKPDAEMPATILKRIMPRLKTS